MATGRDIKKIGDVKEIRNWPLKHTFEEILKMVVDNGWSAAVFGKDGTPHQNRVYFKKVDFQLSTSFTSPEAVVHSIWIYNNPNNPGP